MPVSSELHRVGRNVQNKRDKSDVSCQHGKLLEWPIPVITEWNALQALSTEEQRISLISEGTISAGLI
jgi:hypothetical protein